MNREKMGAREDRLQQRLELWEAGMSLEECQGGLTGEEADLLELAATLGEIAYPGPDRDTVARQRARLLQLAKEQTMNSRGPRSTASRLLPGWFAPVAAAAGGLALMFACLAVVLLGGRAAWRALRPTDVPLIETPAAIAKTERTPTVAEPTRPNAPTAVASPEASPTSKSEHTVYLPFSNSPMPSQNARISEVQGIVEVRSSEGTWSAATEGQILEAGYRVRSGELSSAQVAFYDSSTAFLGAQTEISLDLLGQDPEEGARVIELTQWVGETDHTVVPAYSEGARYEVHTPSGTGAAKGTIFHVVVTPEQIARFSVEEGAVAVTNVDVTVLVIAGQLTVLEPGGTPSQPVFHLTGEGEVTQMGTEWKIAGQAFSTHEDTAIVGDPQVGDWVHVDAHLLPDGTRVADRIVLLRRSPANRFTIIGQVEAIADEAWTIARQSITVNEDTEVESGIVDGDWVQVEGILLQDGTLLARQIHLLEEEPGLPFSFVGVIQQIENMTYTISGIVVEANEETQVDENLIVSDMVAVQGWIVDTTWQASSIMRLGEQEREFEFTGRVQSIDPWEVSGIAFETRSWTDVEDGIEVGDTVKVEGRILEDGTWVASEITLVEEDEQLYIEFIGVVGSIDPWEVSGIEFEVSADTEIQVGIRVGMLVKVKAEILADGTWHVLEIKLVGPGLGVGCVQFTSVVARVEPGQIVLDSGATLPLHPELDIEGDIQVGAVISFYLCTDAEGNITVVSIVVIYQPESESTPTPVPSGTVEPPQPPSAAAVTICHKPGTPAEQTKVLPRSALPGHLGHGDTIGPCTGTGRKKK